MFHTYFPVSHDLLDIGKKNLLNINISHLIVWNIVQYPVFRKRLIWKKSVLFKWANECCFASEYCQTEITAVRFYLHLGVIVPRVGLPFVCARTSLHLCLGWGRPITIILRFWHTVLMLYSMLYVFRPATVTTWNRAVTWPTTRSCWTRGTHRLPSWTNASETSESGCTRRGQRHVGHLYINLHTHHTINKRIYRREVFFIIHLSSHTSWVVWVAVAPLLLSPATTQEVVWAVFQDVWLRSAPTSRYLQGADLRQTFPLNTRRLDKSAPTQVGRNPNPNIRLFH